MIRDRLRYFHEAGLLVKKDLVDTDMLFGIVGPGLEQDYKYLKLIVESSRKVNADPGIYEYFDYLYARYLRWKASQRPRRMTQQSSDGPPPRLAALAQTRAADFPPCTAPLLSPTHMVYHLTEK
jgi:hypothetical protein